MKPHPVPDPLHTVIRDKRSHFNPGIRVERDPAPSFTIRMTPSLLRMAQRLLS